eukprot:TRINITY_DN104313_c0_g1_i1.p1 TRINITY_DN104313_c0_g1~~TRINITY_DN104313_c0_g1_i1.p1  ORF type:complete len:107 (+),score=3.02 TRINITY_DN104313_c0_g1_i1:119-439(+)
MTQDLPSVASASPAKPSIADQAEALTPDTSDVAASLEASGRSCQIPANPSARLEQWLPAETPDGAAADAVTASVHDPALPLAAIRPYKRQAKQPLMPHSDVTAADT